MADIKSFSLKAPQQVKPWALALTGVLAVAAAYLIYRAASASTVPTDHVVIAGQTITLGDPIESLPADSLEIVPFTAQDSVPTFVYQPGANMEAVIFTNGERRVTGFLLYPWATSEPYHPLLPQVQTAVSLNLPLPAPVNPVRLTDYKKIFNQGGTGTNAAGNMLYALEDACTNGYASLVVAVDDDAVLARIKDFIGPHSPRLCG